MTDQKAHRTTAQQHERHTRITATMHYELSVLASSNRAWICQR